MSRPLACSSRLGREDLERGGTNDQFVQDVDVTEECISEGTDDDGAFSLSDALGCYGLEDKIVANESEVDREDEHAYGYAIAEGDKLVKAVRRTNPNKRWDWWQVGGRWSGFLKLKPGASGQLGSRGLMGSHFADGKDRADQALKGDVDLEGMRGEAGDRAGALWDKARDLTGG